MASKDSRVRGMEVFHGKGSVRADLPKVTIQSKGVLTINLASYEGLGKPQSVEFLFNPTERIIGIRAANEEAEHTYQVRGMVGSSTFSISARSFLNFHGIPLDKSLRYTAELVEGILIVDLNQEGAEANRSPAPRIRNQVGGEL